MPPRRRHARAFPAGAKRLPSCHAARGDAAGRARPGPGPGPESLMKILTRHLIRSLLGPFFFSLLLLTGLMFVEAFARYLDAFSGKGLPARVIAESTLLILPHTIALTLPMAVLVAVLYAFSDMAAAGETVAMSGSGVHPRAILGPAALVGALGGVATYVFNDVVLPEANHRLATLQLTISQKSPTFHLREKVFNRIDAPGARGPYFLKADSIDPVTNRLENVVVHDLSRPLIRRTTYAATGQMAMSAQLTDLQLQLRDGRSYEIDKRAPETLQRTEFENQLSVLNDVGNLFEMAEGNRRSEREMSMAQLRQAAGQAKADLAALRAQAGAEARQVVEQALGTGPAADSLRALAEAQARDGEPVRARWRDDLSIRTRTDAEAQAAQADYLARRVSMYRVEFHKKLVLATGCIVFVLIGVPLGVRFPLGGVGMVILVSTVVFGTYSMSLENGEDLADRRLMSPFWAMWTPSLFFLLLGGTMVARLGRWVNAARTDTWASLRESAATLLASLFKRTPAAK